MQSKFAVAFAVSIFLACTAFAQENQGGVITEQQSEQVLSKKYIGSSVFSGQGENTESVGEISALIFNESDEIVGAVVDVGGFLGIGAKPVGIDWSLLSMETIADSNVFTTSMTREDFEQAPEFKDKAAQRAEQQRQEMEAEQESTTGSTGTTY